ARPEPTGVYEGLTSTRNGCGTRPRTRRTFSGTGAGSSITAIRSPTPTCGAARPTPGAARMVRRSAATNRASGPGSSWPSNGSAARRSTGSPAATMGNGPPWARSSSTRSASGARSLDVSIPSGSHAPTPRPARQDGPPPDGPAPGSPRGTGHRPVVRGRPLRWPVRSLPAGVVELAGERRGDPQVGLGLRVPALPLEGTAEQQPGVALDRVTFHEGPQLGLGAAQLSRVVVGPCQHQPGTGLLRHLLDQAAQDVRGARVVLGVEEHPGALPALGGCSVVVVHGFHVTSFAGDNRPGWLKIPPPSPGFPCHSSGA